MSRQQREYLLYQNLLNDGSDGSPLGMIFPKQGKIWQCPETFFVIPTGKCSWLLVDGGQGCCYTSHDAQDSILHQRLSNPVSTVPGLGSPGLVR